MSKTSIVLASAVAFSFIWFVFKVIIDQELLYSIAIGIFIYAMTLVEACNQEPKEKRANPTSAVPHLTFKEEESPQDSDDEEDSFRHRASSDVPYLRFFNEEDSVISDDDAEDDVTRYSRYQDFLHARLQLDPFEEDTDHKSKGRKKGVLRKVWRRVLKPSCVSKR